MMRANLSTFTGEAEGPVALMDVIHGTDSGLVIDWTQMPTYNTIMAVTVGAGLLFLVQLGRALRRDANVRPEAGHSPPPSSG